MSTAISSKSFSYNKQNRAFTAEASDLMAESGKVVHLTPMDDGTVGFGMRSAVTSDTFTFKLVKVEREHGELIAWHYVAIGPVNITATVFND